MITEYWHYQNENEKNIIVIWLSNIYQKQLKNGLANITHEKQNEKILTLRLIQK